MTEREKKNEELRKRKNEAARNWYYAHREYVLQREKEKYRNSTLNAPPKPKPKKPKQTKKKLTALQKMIRFYEEWNSKIKERLDNETLDDFQLWALNLTLKSNEEKIKQLNG